QVVCRELATKPVDFVVIESDAEARARAEETRFLALEGDASDEEVLLAAGIARARGLFACLSRDADNVFVPLTAKQLNPAIYVVARAENERSERTLSHARADRVISPYTMGGHRMAQAVLRPAVLDVIDLATHHQNLALQLEEVGVLAGSALDGATLQE